MSRLFLSFVFVSLAHFNSVGGQIQGTKKQLGQDVESIMRESANSFRLPSRPQNNLQRYQKLRQMSEQERRRFEVGVYETFVGICKAQNIDHCAHADIKFYASLIAKGDKQCALTCSKQSMIKNQNLMPRGVKTKACIADIEKFMLKKDPASKTDQAEIKNALMSGCSAIGKSPCSQKRFFILPFIPAIIGLVNLAGIAVANYIEAMSESETTSYINQGVGTTGDALKVVNHVKKAATAARRGCFSADSHVNVLSNTGDVVEKLLRDVKLGDMVESVDEETGLKTFSKVYYIEHENEDHHSQLLRILYKNRFNETQFIGLSDRHLVYATKRSQPAANAPLKEPMMAMNVEVGDVIWAMEEGKLVPRKVAGVMTYHNAARHPLTENHHMIVDGVHASVHILDEGLYRWLTYPLRWTFWANPEWNRSWLLKKLVRVVENGKEPFFSTGPTGGIEFLTGSGLQALFSSPVSG